MSQPRFPKEEYHANYLDANFDLGSHKCGGGCSCVGLGCDRHWQWKNGKPPPGGLGYYWRVGYQLIKWNAFRGQRAGGQKKKSDSFVEHYAQIVKLVVPLDGTTIFCDWNEDQLAEVYDKVSSVYPTGQGRSAVAASKTLYMLVPDLFVILDKKQTWAKWKMEMSGSGFGRLGTIYQVDGRCYVELLKHVREKISAAVGSGKSFTLADSDPISLRSLPELRLVRPLGAKAGYRLPHTFCKVIDNIIR